MMSISYKDLAIIETLSRLSFCTKGYLFGSSNVYNTCQLNNVLVNERHGTTCLTSNIAQSVCALLYPPIFVGFCLVLSRGEHVVNELRFSAVSGWSLAAGGLRTIDR